MGLKPTVLGEMPNEQVKPDELVKIDENESRLCYQEFFLKPNTRFLDFLNENKSLRQLFCGSRMW